jgi:hypothetical protein
MVVTIIMTIAITNTMIKVYAITGFTGCFSSLIYFFSLLFLEDF